jgi:hypothetical protein
VQKKNNLNLSIETEIVKQYEPAEIYWAVG